MKWADAVKASPVLMAFRYPSEDSPRSEPNVVLLEGGQWQKPKAFLAFEPVAWERRPLKDAKHYTDWRPAKTRDAPALRAPDVVTQLGDVAEDGSQRC